MKKRGITVLILIVIFVLSGCGNGVENSDFEEDGSVQNDLVENGGAIPLEFTSAKNGDEDYDILEYPLSKPEGWTYGDVSANGESLFYIVAEEQYMGNYMLKAKIMVYNMETKEESVCFQYENENGFYLNELEGTSEWLFWVHSEGKHQWIECANLLTGEISVIEEVTDDYNSILLQTDGDFLTWHIITDSGPVLYGYDIAAQHRFLISDVISMNHSYTRANITEGITSFVSEKDGKRFIQIYDMKEKAIIKEIGMDAEADIFDAKADEQYYICTIFSDNGSVDDRIFVYDYIQEELYLANGTDDADVFSVCLIDGKLFINERNTNSILVRDLEHMTETVLMDEEDHLYILESAVENFGYVAYDAAGDEKSKILYISNAC